MDLRFDCRSLRRRWLLAGLLVVVGCAYRGFDGSVPTQSPPPFSSSGLADVPDCWWLAFDDPALAQQIDVALDDSFTLAAAMQRLRASRAVARREASNLFPDINGVADWGGNYGPGEDVSSLVWGLDSSYQVDLWGQIESRVEAERLLAAATFEDYQAVALTLSAEIARTWYALVEANAQLELLAEQIDTNRTGLKLQEARFGLGLIRSADVLRQRQLVESTLEQDAVVRSRIEVLEHQLAVLSGQLPQAMQYNAGVDLPGLPPLPTTGLPSELLQRRPDVRRDYYAFMSADRDLAAAITDQYPRISLTGSVLNVAESPETLFRDWFVSIASQLVAPLVDGGQRRAEVDRTTAVLYLRFNEYGQTMLRAFQEVEDALARERYQLERLEHLDEQVEYARQASQQLREQYLIGDTDYLSVLTAITAQQRLQRETLAARLELVQIRIALYLALAGGFDPCQQCDLELEVRADEMPAELPVVDELIHDDDLPLTDDLILSAKRLHARLRSASLPLPTTEIDKLADNANGRGRDSTTTSQETRSAVESSGDRRLSPAELAAPAELSLIEALPAENLIDE